VLKVHKLREVMALVGFARLEPVVKGVDGDPIDQHSVEAKRADINNKELDWVPAIENFGEGLFLGVSEAKLRAWTDSDGVKQHSSKHREACKLWNRDHGLKPDDFTWPGAPYLMLHSLAHLLITSAVPRVRLRRFSNQGADLQLSRPGLRNLALHKWQRFRRHPRGAGVAG